MHQTLNERKMDFIENNIYHVYNQGNNQQRIFFNYDNQILFLDKIRKHILPYADVLAWCLMSNHFHIMIYVNRIVPEIEESDAKRHQEESFAKRHQEGSDAKRLTLLDEQKNVSAVSCQNQTSEIVTATSRQTQFLKNHCSKDHTLNYSIGIMLSSYTQILNKQQKRSGSLFRPNTKSECITTCNGITPSFFNTNDGTLLNKHLSEKEYPKVCFDYIHNNPVKAGLVKNPEDWEFSSFRDVYGMRKGNLINRERIEEYGLR